MSPLAGSRGSPLAVRSARAAALALALLATGSAAGQERGQAEDIGAALEQASALLSAGRPEEAEAIYRGLAERYPRLADAHEGLAGSLAAQGRRSQAASVLLELGQGWLAGGDVARAAGYLEQAAELAPESAAAHAALGRALLLAQAFGRGAQHLARAVELGDRSVPTRTYLASALWETGRLAEAEAMLREAAAGGAPAPRQQLGRLLLWQGRHDEAVAVLAALAGPAPRSPDLALEWAQALEGAGRLTEAIAAYRRAATLAPGRSQTHYRLARLLHRSGEPEAAAAEMESFRRLQREEQERVRRQGLERARLDRGWDLLRTGEHAAAAAQFASLPPGAESLRGLGLALAAAGRHREAAEALERAVALAPERQDLRLLLADERAAAEPP